MRAEAVLMGQSERPDEVQEIVRTPEQRAAIDAAVEMTRGLVDACEPGVLSVATIACAAIDYYLWEMR